MTDVDTDYGDASHPPALSAPASWVDCLQAVLDEVTADLQAAHPDAKELGGVALPGTIEGNVRPLVACTWLELTQVQAHSWLPSTVGRSAWTDLMRSAERNSQHVTYPQVVHNHSHGEPCNRGCRLVRPDFDNVSSTQTRVKTRGA